MHDGQIAVLDALQRTQRFLDDNGGLFTAAVDLTAARKWLDEIAASLTDCAFDQDVGVRGARKATEEERQLRKKLRREQMEPITVIARLTLRSTRQFNALQLPKRNMRGQGFIASARAMADAAWTHRETFWKYGLPSTFLDEFESAIAKLEALAIDRQKNCMRRAGATKALAVGARHGRTVLKVLDAVLRQALAENVSILREWQAARHIRRGKANTTPRAATVEAQPLAVVAST